MKHFIKFLYWLGEKDFKVFEVSWSGNTKYVVKWRLKRFKFLGWYDYAVDYGLVSVVEYCDKLEDASSQMSMLYKSQDSMKEYLNKKEMEL